jgi:hypothetical protein
MITCIYRIIFGILIILAELRVTYLLRPFAFLTHFIGIGTPACVTIINAIINWPQCNNQ